MVRVKTEVEPSSEADSDQWLKKWAEENEGFKDEVNVKPEDFGDVKVDKCLEVEGKSEVAFSVILNPPKKTKKLCDVSNNEGNKEINVLWKHKTHKISQEAEMLLKDLCTNAPVSDTFYDKCLFNCLECNSTFKSWTNLRRHSLRIHGKTISYVQVGQLISRAISYICKICSEKLLCDNRFLHRHLKRHKMSIGQYASKFVTSRGQPDEGISYSENVIGNLCLYKCEGCKLKFKFKNCLLHHQDKFLPCKQTGTIVQKVHHCCKLCKRIIVCSIKNLKDHFTRCHNISLKKYCNITGCKMDKNHKKSPTPSHDLENSANDNNNMLSRSISESKNIKKVWLINRLLEKLCQDAPVSNRVFNKCMFQCLDCPTQIRGWRQFRKHIKMHNVAILSLTAVEQYISKQTCYICKICSAKLLCDSFFINRHLKMCHDMHLSQYRAKFEPDWYGAEATMSENVIGNLCLYECKECNQTFENQNVLSKHRAKYLHTINTVQHSLTKSVWHKCKLCKRRFLCDLTVLKKHIAGCHRFSLEEYSIKTGCKIAKNRVVHISQKFLKSLEISNITDDCCIFACNLCGKKYYSSNGFKNHFKNHSSSLCKPLSEYIVKGFSYQCQKCDKLLLCDKDTIRHHMHVHARRGHGAKVNNKSIDGNTKKTQYLIMCQKYINDSPRSFTVWDKTALPMNQVPIKEITAKIGNLCQFICKKCTDFKIFNSWDCLRHHYEKIHRCRVQYNHSIVNVARCHACLICPKAILCDRSFIRRHLTFSHKMTLKRYETIFHRNGGETLPTFLDWMTSEQNTD